MSDGRRQAGLTPTEVLRLLAAGPTDQVLFLAARRSVRSVAESLTALANGGGGLALLGVTQKGSVQGQVAPDTLQQRAMDAGLTADPPLHLSDVQSVVLAQGTLLVISVPAGLPHVYSVQGRYLTRTGGQNRPLSSGELRQLLIDRAEISFESKPAAEADLAELDLQAVGRYLERRHPVPVADPMAELRSLGCVTAAHGTLVPTVAGILLFGHDPQRFVRSAEIVCVRYAGPTMADEFVRQEIRGAVAEQIRQAEAFIVGNMRREIQLAGMARRETPEYLLPVVREALVNAVAHRDYSIQGEGIRLLIFSDRLQIYSPGRLPGHVTLENLQRERYSRNAILVSVLAELGYIERLGYGIDRMIETMRSAQLPEPLFEETAAGFQVTLQSAAAVAAARDRPWPHGFLNERQEAAMAHLRQVGRITNSDFQALAPEVSAETIRRDLADLVEKNLLLKIGEKRATYYILK